MSIKNFVNKRPKVVIVAVLGTVVLLCLIAGIIVWQVVDWDKDDSDKDDSDDNYFLEPSESELGIYSTAAVSTDAPHCSDIGKDMLERSGRVVDAAIAAALCVGLIQAQSMGIGGGFFAIHYEASTGKARALNARERAPYEATENMFDGNPTKAARGPLSVAVPGELMGYWELWREYGKLEWSDLFQPTIELAEKGFNVTAHAANALRQNSRNITQNPSMSVFVNNETGEVYKEGELLRRPVLAETLRKIANTTDRNNPPILYQNSQLMKDFVDDLREMGGIMIYDDMLNYTATWDPPMEVNITGGFTVHSMPPPGSGILVGFILKLLSNFEMKSDSIKNSQRLVEAFKHAYAKRTILGDPWDPDVAEEVEELRKNLTESTTYLDSVLKMIQDDSTHNTYDYYGAEFYQPEDHGTSHISVIAPNGDAIALTASVNLYFGSWNRSESTGIIYNDLMDDFSSPNVTNQFGVPPSINNFIKPHKRPVSSMAPAIITDQNGKVRLVVGAAGGTKITTAVTSVAMRTLWYGDTIKEAIDARRLHHQLYPMEMEYEIGFNERIIDGLKNIGHVVKEQALGASVVQAIAVSDNGTIYANADFRKRGTVAGY